jgi:dolichol-phosphate mannosyltransferase
VAIIDADLQHPPEHLLQLYEAAWTQDADIAIATRYQRGGSYEGLNGFSRRFYSLGLKWLAKLVFPDQLWGISDPLGGFFLIRTDLLDNVELRPIGYKISLEVLLRCQWARVTEVPYRFQKRNNGASKSDFSQGLNVLQHMARLLREVPAAGRFWKYCAAGIVSMLLSFLIFALAQSVHAPLWLSWLAATETSIIADFALNDQFVWRDRAYGTFMSRLERFHLALLVSSLVGMAIFLAGVALHHEWLSFALGSLVGMLGGYWAMRHAVFAPVASVGGWLVNTWAKARMNVRVSAGLVLTGGLIANVTALGGWVVVVALALGAALWL